MKRLGTLSAALCAAVLACGGPSKTVVPTDSTIKPQPGDPVEGAQPAEPTEPAAAPAELVFPDEEFRAQPPQAGEPRPLKPPTIERFKLANGIEVYLVERHELPTVSMQLVLEGGSMNDPAGKEGLARTCMTLLGDGTEALDKIAFNEALADMASSVQSFAGRDQQGIAMASLSRSLDPTLDLWADTILRPGLRQEDFERDVKQSLASLKQSKGAPATLGQRILPIVTFGAAHPFGRLSTEASYGALALDDCKKYVADYVKPQGAKLYIVGDVTQAQVKEKVGKRLAAWKGKPRASVKIAKPKAPAGKLFFVDIPNAPQSQIYLVHAGPARKSPDYFETYVMSQVLGGSFASRINMNIREAKGWAYGAGGGFRYLRTFGFFAASASVRADTTKDSILEIWKEMNGMLAAEISDEELAREVNGAILSLPGQMATGGQVLQTFQELVYFGLPLDYYGSYVAKMRKVTKALVKKAATKHLKPNDVQVLVVGDAKVVLAGLEELVTSGALGKGELVILDADGKVITPAK